MSSSKDEGGGNLAGALVLVGIIAIFVISGVAPFFQMASAPIDTMSIGDAVATRADNVKYQAAQSDADKGVVTQFEKLSRTKIQEKLNRVPVFYLVKDGTMASQIYLNFQDAEQASKEEGFDVKCTTLDQVMYPLVLNRGRMRMALPPVEIQKAETILESDPETKFQLVANPIAIQDANDLGMTNFVNGDVPLFAANKLAFAGQQGPQVPLFLNKADCLTSYTRLKESSTNKNLEEQPTIRVTTLKDVLFSMERGTRPAVSQLQFYTSENDLIRASDLMSPILP